MLPDASAVDVVNTGGGFHRVTSGSEKALREVSDGLLDDLELLAQLEERKRLMEPDDPRAHELAQQVAVLASRVLSWSISEEKITKDALESARQGDADAPSRSIEQTPRATRAILEDWRAAERRVAAASPGTADHAKAALEAERFRQEYQQAFEQRQNDR
jgi:hypothetical protein